MTVQARRTAERSLPRVMRPAYAIAAVLAAVLTVGAQAATADGFQRGDVLASVGNPSFIARFAPDGTPKGTLADSAGAGPLCFDPSGEHLIAPGTGLYDSAGTRLASAWASVSPIGDCTVDKAGNVYLAGGPFTGDRLTGRATIRKFDLAGHPLDTYNVDATGYTYIRSVYSLDLAPDQCTLYYGLGGGEEIKRYDVCTNTQLPLFGGAGICDQLRVRTNGQVTVTCDTGGALLNTSGTGIVSFANPNDPLNNNLRFAALDADGTSFWMGTLAGLLARYDIASGQRVDRWTAGPGLGGVAVYNSPRRRRRAPGPAAAPTQRRAPRARPRSARRPSRWRRRRPRSTCPPSPSPTAGCSRPGARCSSTRACR